MKKFSVALIGNPNVGKSTIFNMLTNLNQHTGNWTGKTVMTARGNFKIGDYIFEITDLPGTYSLNPRAEDEMIACDYILNAPVDAIVIVVDENCVGRNLLLALQIMRHRKNVILCLNFVDEAKEKNIYVDKGKLKKILGVPVVETSAKKNVGLNILRYELLKMCLGDYAGQTKKLTLPPQTEKLLEIAQQIENLTVEKKFVGDDFTQKLDGICSHKFFALPIMFLLLLAVFWLTIFGANYFSDLLAIIFSKCEALLRNIFAFFHVSDFLTGIFVDGMYRTVAWVIAVMFPPMAIFFPLFAILEDFGFLPRIAFNLDGIFKKFGAHGKQSLSMCMGFGCNAAGVVSCRTIDSKREKLIAILTNNFIPCNGRFPGLIILSSMLVSGNFVSLKTAAIISLVIIFSVAVTLVVSKILSVTLLKGEPSFFILELPPYRKPNFFQVFVRTLFDKTFLVLYRAIIVAIPAGILIWLSANVNLNGSSVLQLIVNFFEPLGKLMHLDGTILTAFLFGLPANEIVLPLIIMAYENKTVLAPVENFINVKQILIENGWGVATIISTMIFYLNHFPCSTTLLTIKKETRSLKWTLIAFLLPTLVGILFCIVLPW